MIVTILKTVNINHVRRKQFYKFMQKDLMHREYTYSLPTKVNGKCVYKGKLRTECLIYEVKSSMCDARQYTADTQKKN